MENIDIDGTPFSVLLDRAVKIKSSQSAALSSKYNALPTFVQCSIFPSDEVINARNLVIFSERLNTAMTWKEEGNASYRDGQFDDALEKYKMALSLFRHVENSNPNIKNEGIKDEYLREVIYVAKSEDEKMQLQHFLVKIYNNLALVALKRMEYQTAIQACDCAIEVDKANDKSFYLRAQARLLPKCSTSTDEELAMKDLKTAAEINPKNKQTRTQLSELRVRVKSQRVKDEDTFAGLFDRGEVYYANELDEEKEARRKYYNEKDKGQDVILGRQLAQMYAERGMVEEKAKIEKSLKLVNDGSASEQLMKDIDFRNPTTKMIEEADAMGVDLSDPQTIELLEQMKQEQINGNKMNDCTISCDEQSVDVTKNATQSKYSLSRLLKALRGATMLCVMLIVYVRIVNTFLYHQMVKV